MSYPIIQKEQVTGLQHKKVIYMILLLFSYIPVSIKECPARS